MHSPIPPRNPLATAAQEVQAVARQTRWPWMEKAAMGVMAASAALTTAIGVFQIRHLWRREMREEQREIERERRAAEAPPPPERPGYGVAATAGMPEPGREDGEGGRWSRKEAHAQAEHRPGQARQ